MEFGKGTSYYTFFSPSITNYRLWRHQILLRAAEILAMKKQMILFGFIG